MKEIDTSQPVQVEFGRWFEKGFALYKENFGTLVVAMLIVWALGTVTLGILLPPLTAGFLLICLRLIDENEPPPTAGDVFKGFSVFLHSFLFCLLWFVVIFIGACLLGMVPCVGQLASIFLSYAVQALLLFSLFLIAEEDMDFWTASTRSMEVVKTNFWPFLGLTIVAGIIGSLGTLACFIGVVFTAPITLCVYAVAYRAVFAGETPADSQPALEIPEDDDPA